MFFFGANLLADKTVTAGFREKSFVADGNAAGCVFDKRKEKYAVGNLNELRFFMGKYNKN